MNWVHVTSFHLTCQQQWRITMRPVIHRYKSPDWFSETQCSVTLWLHTYVWPMQLVLSLVRITECSGGSPWDRWSTEINHRIDFLKLNAQPHYGYTHMYDRCIWCCHRYESPYWLSETQCSRPPDDLVLTGPTGVVTRGSVPVFRRDVGNLQSFLCNAFISRYRDASPLLRTPPLELNAV